MSILASAPTIEDLRTTSVTSSPIVAVLAFSAPGDGGGGIFQWISTATDQEDGGLVFNSKPAVAKGRWKRVFGQSLNGRWFRAKGDGATDGYRALQQSAAA